MATKKSNDLDAKPIKKVAKSKTLPAPVQYTVRIYTKSIRLRTTGDEDDYMDDDEFIQSLIEHPECWRTVIAIALSEAEAAYKAALAFAEHWPKDKLCGMFIEKNVKHQVVVV